MRRPVILIVIKGLGIGGAERLITEAVQFWDRETYDYRVAYLLPWKDQLVGELEASNVPVMMVGGKRGVTLATAIRLRRAIIDSDAALVHAHLPMAGIIARLVSPVPVVYTEHNIPDSYRTPTRQGNRLTYPRNRTLIAVSDAVASAVAGYPGPAPLVIENGVSMATPPKTPAMVRDELGLENDAELVVHVGNIRPHKGHANLIEATRTLQRQRPTAVVVSIGGEKHPGDLERLRTEARDRGVADSIRFLGRREDARSFIAAADVVVNPSDFEGLPIALLESMALARPVVATSVGGVPTLIEEGASGLLVPPKNPDRLAEALIALLSQPDVRREMGKNASERVSRDFGLEPMVRSVEKVYSELLRAQ